MRHIAIFFFLSLILSGCHGIFDGIYDDAPDDNTFVEGFHPGKKANQMTLMLNATSYDHWIYIDLHNRTFERHEIPRQLTGTHDGRSGMTYQLVEGKRYTRLSMTPTDPQSEAESWDLAIHHFDVKTNGGEVARKDEGRFYSDEWTDNQVIVDIREMMGLKIGYQNSMVNRVLSSWIDMDISSPPPVYTASADTYILRMTDGTSASIKFRNYMSDRGTKGYLTIDITYPL